MSQLVLCDLVYRWLLPRVAVRRCMAVTGHWVPCLLELSPLIGITAGYPIPKTACGQISTLLGGGGRNELFSIGPTTLVKKPPYWRCWLSLWAIIQLESGPGVVGVEGWGDNTDLLKTEEEDSTWILGNIRLALKRASVFLSVPDSIWGHPFC